MFIRRKIYFSVLLIILLLLTTACSGTKSTGQADNNSSSSGNSTTKEPMVLKLGHIGSLENEYNLMAERFKEEVEKRTNGRYIIQIYPARQLGGDREIIEAMQYGNVDAGVVTSSVMVNFVPEMGVLDMPYIFKDWEHIERFAKSEALQELLKEGEKAGLICLGVLPRGFRSITNSKHPIRVPEDLKDIKLRVIESPVFVNTFKLFGGTVVPMAAGEVYTALQQKTIDAQENTPAVNYYERFYEVQKYFSLTEHIAAWGVVTISKVTWDKIPPEDQKLFREAALAAQEVETKLQREREAEFMKKLQEKGMIINDDVDREAFAKVTRPVVEDWIAKNGDKYIKAIKELE
ncbi:tripartite ATP-independent transporter solute receptor, DctP family [Caldanaerovirga acetigignens]|uniref:Tripartite ATP-independent transporter solute receptor, DctP family n=1 Tax=Caldanaerovirga acetigignens TaxID=447595 RepID=A0A1M7LQK2_9FIRM|nr:TRAP transporter substrate-binding protein [Caldanaerovirga acetigignens]SHM80468.1 tripartite ATP-independent transporter solute receptor, DctP family [Caldanaerovirga acetigignens]